MIYLDNLQPGDIVLVSSKGAPSWVSKLSQSLLTLSLSRATHVLIAVTEDVCIHAQKPDSSCPTGVRINDYYQLQTAFQEKWKLVATKRLIAQEPKYSQKVYDACGFFYGQAYNKRFFTKTTSPIYDSSFCSELAVKVFDRVGVELGAEITKRVFKRKIVWPVHLQFLDPAIWEDVTSQFHSSSRIRATNPYRDQGIEMVRSLYEQRLDHHKFLDREVPNIPIQYLETAAELYAKAIVSGENVGAIQEPATFYDRFFVPLEALAADYQWQSQLKLPERMNWSFQSSYPSLKLNSDLIILEKRIERFISQDNATPFTRLDLDRSQSVLDKIDVKDVPKLNELKKLLLTLLQKQ